MINYYVYILCSELDGTFYKGFTTDFRKRLIQHNNGESHYTSTKMPWKLIYVEKCDNKTKALKRERSLKRSNTDYLRWLIHQSSNLLNQTKMNKSY